MKTPKITRNQHKKNCFPQIKNFLVNLFKIPLDRNSPLLEVYNKCMSNYDQQQTRSDLSNRYIKVFKDLFKKPCEIERESWQSCITHENARPWLLFIYGAMTVVSLYKIYRNMRAKSARITFNTNVSLKRRASN